MTTEANIRDAIEDLKAEPKAINEIAAEYGIAVEVLAARFAKAYPNGVLAKVDVTAKIEEAITKACARYRVPRDRAMPLLTKDGKRVTVVCRIGTTKVIAVDHEIAHTWEMGQGCFSNASLRMSMGA